jgi:branched-chain amino acid transport system substrate-binding protein
MIFSSTRSSIRRLLVPNVYKYGLHCCLAVALSGIFYAPEAYAQKSIGTIFLGQSAPLSGPTEALGLDVRRGVEAYLHFVNRSGGVNGRNVLLKSFDDKGNASLAGVNAHRLIQEEGVIALIASIGTKSSEAVAEVASASRVPLVAPFSGAASLRSSERHYVYNLRAELTQESRYLARQLASMGLRSVAAAYQNDADGLEGVNAFEQACRELGLNLVAKMPVGTSISETREAAKAMASKAPQAIMLFANYDVGVDVIRASRIAGYGAIFMTVSSAGSKAINEQLLDAARGMGMTQVMPFPWSEAVGLVSQYQKLMIESGFSAKDFSYGSLEGYAAARVLVEGLRRSGKDISAARLTSALDGLGEWDLGGLRLNYSTQRREGARYIDLTVIGQDGRFLK